MTSIANAAHTVPSSATPGALPGSTPGAAQAGSPLPLFAQLMSGFSGQGGSGAPTPRLDPEMPGETVSAPLEALDESPPGPLESRTGEALSGNLQAPAGGETQRPRPDSPPDPLAQALQAAMQGPPGAADPVVTPGLPTDTRKPTGTDTDTLSESRPAPTAAKTGAPALPTPATGPAVSSPTPVTTLTTGFGTPGTQNSTAVTAAPAAAPSAPETSEPGAVPARTWPTATGSAPEATARPADQSVPETAAKPQPAPDSADLLNPGLRRLGPNPISSTHPTQAMTPAPATAGREATDKATTPAPLPLAALQRGPRWAMADDKSPGSTLNRPAIPTPPLAPTSQASPVSTELMPPAPAPAFESPQADTRAWTPPVQRQTLPADGMNPPSTPETAQAVTSALDAMSAEKDLPIQAKDPLPDPSPRESAATASPRPTPLGVAEPSSPPLPPLMPARGEAPLPGLGQAAAAQAQAPLNLSQPGWGQALGEQMLWMVRHGNQQAEIKVNPRELGPLEVSLSMEKDRAKVTFFSHDQGVRAALESALPKLRELFDASGVQLGQASVSDQPDTRQQADGGGNRQAGSGSGSGSGENASRGDDGEFADPAGEPTTATPSSGRWVPAGGVDHYV